MIGIYLGLGLPARSRFGEGRDLVIGISRKMELSKQKNYQQSFDLACASIQGMNLEERAKKAGADYQKGEDGEKITIPFFSEPYHLQFPQIEFYSPSEQTQERKQAKTYDDQTRNSV